ncbi:YihY/virulence factor BrkB family protein [Bombilactobacillus bombi]|uniref:YihY/virulence factor BrkB family protein n=1 Tax=Bombilactobacillus bombi TaxID=1303590 RepID=UPI0015E60ED4|nr:YihY/virulence factor BrkB family protein [Bombilactobacillus bombi]MBA1434782.1 YihY/virulence factor BrkB family protein [Bombilactobacillus bombi]
MTANTPTPLFATQKSLRDKLTGFIKLVLQKIKNGNINLSSKAIVYYSLLSFFPLISLLGSVIPLFHLDVNTVLEYLRVLTPAKLQQLLEPLIVQLLTHSSGGLLSFGILGTLWTSSGVVNILRRSVNSVYGFDNEKMYTQTDQSLVNSILLRVVSIFLTAFFIVILTALLITLVLGQQFLNWIKPIFSWAPLILNLFLRWKWPVTLLTLIIIMLIAYYLLPNSHIHFRYIWLGAAFSAAGFIILVQFFSLYLHFFGRRWNSYGTIGTFFILILWLNFIGYIFLIGAALNAAFAQAWLGELRPRNRWHFLAKN